MDGPYPKIAFVLPLAAAEFETPLLLYQQLYTLTREAETVPLPE